MANEEEDYDKPEYYQGSIEVIDMIISMGYGQTQGFLKGNIIKYTIRHSRKSGTTDLKKANWYLNLLMAVDAWANKGHLWEKVPTAREMLESYGRS